MVEIHGLNRNKSSEKKPNVFAHVDADLGRSTQGVKARNDSEETGFKVTESFKVTTSVAVSSKFL